MNINSSKKVYIAEFFGTAILVFIGCGAVLFGQYGSDASLAPVPLAIASGGALAALIYCFGHVSGCHINPSVTIAFWIAGRMEHRFVLGYLCAQIGGAILGAGLLVGIASGSLTPQTINLGPNGWGEGVLGEYNTVAAFSIETLMTFIFIFVTLGATEQDAFLPFGGAVVGLTLAILIIAFYNVTGVSLNPARSTGAALFSGHSALSQLWLFILGPILGASFAALLYRGWPDPQSG